jgi:hypothetical protein
MAGVLNLIGTPPGTDYCNVYLLRSSDDVSVFESKGDYSGKTYYYSRQGSRENYVSGIVDIDDSNYLSGRQYLGLKNTDLNDGVVVNLQVVAVVYDEPTVNGWTPSVKQNAYELIQGQFSKMFAGQVSENDVSRLSACITKQFTEQFNPQQMSGYAKFELSEIFSKIGEGCSRDLNLDLTHVIPAQNSFDEKHIIGKWRDQNSTFTFFETGNINIKWDNGNFKLGKWEIEGNKLVFILDFGKRRDEYIILELTGSQLKYIGVGEDKTVWSAKRI